MHPEGPEIIRGVQGNCLECQIIMGPATVKSGGPTASCLSCLELICHSSSPAEGTPCVGVPCQSTADSDPLGAQLLITYWLSH